MARKVWVLCHVDNFGQMDMNSICGGYATKEEAASELKRLTDKFGPQGFEVRQVSYDLIKDTCV